MKYNEIKGDLFKVDESYTLVHCISSDCRMGAGIAVEFTNRNPHMKNWLKKRNPLVKDVLFYNEGNNHNILNLITKDKYYHKPRRKDFNDTLENLKFIVEWYEIKKLAMPLIGSRLDKLSWDESSKFVKEIFADTDVEILVVKL